MLGIAPALGRDFAATDDRPGAAGVVMLSDELWRRRYNADPAIVGRALTINAHPHAVIGVLPPRVKFPFLQIGVDGAGAAGRTRATRRPATSRCSAAWPPAQSQEQASDRRWPPSRRGSPTPIRQNAGWSVRVDPLHELLHARRRAAGGADGDGRGDAGAAHRLRQRGQPAAGARHGARARDVGAGRAGAGRGRIVRQLLTESVLLGAGERAARRGAGLRPASGRMRAAVPADDVPVPRSTSRSIR